MRQATPHNRHMKPITLSSLLFLLVFGFEAFQIQFGHTWIWPGDKPSSRHRYYQPDWKC